MDITNHAKERYVERIKGITDKQEIKRYLVTEDEKIVKEIFWGLPLQAKILDLEFSQNRTHKRKRINKKWAKRYGYTCTVFYK